MKKFKIFVVIFCFSFVGMQLTTAQTETEVQEKVYKISTNDIPDKVKETLRNYSGYTISKEATFVKKSNENIIYTFKVKKGIWVNYLLIDEKGKVRGVKSNEGKE